jgi:hypothetical protein
VPPRYSASSPSGARGRRFARPAPFFSARDPRGFRRSRDPAKNLHRCNRCAQPYAAHKASPVPTPADVAPNDMRHIVA